MNAITEIPNSIDALTAICPQCEPEPENTKDNPVLYVTYNKAVTAPGSVIEEKTTWFKLLETIARQDVESPRQKKEDCMLFLLTRVNGYRDAAHAQAVYGIEGDYDSGGVSMDDAITMLEYHRIKAAIFPSPRHTPENPRWRVIAPLAQAVAPIQRTQLVARLNGALGGILASESFSIARAYYFGATVQNKDHYKVILPFDDASEGLCIDEMHELDAIAIGKDGSTTQAINPAKGPINAPYEAITAKVDYFEAFSQKVEHQGIGPWIFEEKVQQLGRKLCQGDGGRDLLKQYIASQSARAQTWKEIAALLDFIFDKYFDPSYPRHEYRIDELIFHFARKDDAKRQAHAAVDLSGFIGTAPNWTQPGYTTDAPPGYPHKWTDQETGETGFFDNDGNRYRTEDEREAYRQAQLEQHPLAQFVTVDAQPKQPKWIIRGFLADGVTVIAGSGGVGKTTAILPLTLCAAGLTGNDLAQADMQPRHWRHVVYVTEDVGQAQRIVAGVIGHGDLAISLPDVQERFHLVPAMRLSVDIVVQVGELYSRRFTRMIGDVPVAPLIVFDTKSAVFELEDENSNSETSRMVAALKQCFHSLPVWLIAHVAKSNMGRDDVKTARGASSQGDDGNGTAFLIEGKEPDKRYLVLGKKRFEPKWPELEITSHTAVTTATDEYGIPEPLTLRWSTAAPPTQSRQEAAEAAEIEQRRMDEITLRLEIFNAVETAWHLGNPLNRAGVKAKIARKASAVVAMLEILLSERWLHEVEVPKNLRTHPRRSSFLVKLTTEEHDALMAGKGLPAEKTTIPESWQKAPIPIVPESEPGNGQNKEDAA